MSKLEGNEEGAFDKQDLTSVLNKIKPDDKSGKISIGDIIESLESRGFGPLLFVPSLIAIMPTGGIPGVPTVCGMVIALLSVQMILGKDQPWLPSFVNKIEFGKDKLKSGLNIATKVTAKIDKLTAPRIEMLSSAKAKKGIAFICILAALAMIPLEALPFAVMIPASSILLISIGLITKDGYITLTALLLNIATIYFIFTKFIESSG